MPRQSLPAVIVGFETNGLGVARALQREGIQSISLAGPGWSPSCVSWATKVTMSSGWSEEALVSDLVAIGKTLDAKAPLLITKDEPVLWISANRSALSEYFAIAMPEPEIVSLLMDKIRFQAFATERGWPLPNTWLANSREELDNVLERITYPCILKPAVKNNEFRRSSPRKAFKIFSATELRETYALVSSWEPEVIVQEWIGGGDDRIAFGLGYWNGDSRDLAIFAGRKLRQWPPECGNTALSEPAPADWQPDVLRLTEEIYSSIGYRGIGSIEYKVAPDRRLIIMEPTVGRTNYQNEVAVLNGVNLPAIAYYDGAGMTSDLERLIDGARKTHRATKLVDNIADYRSARSYMAESRLTLREWLSSRRGHKQDMLFRLADPMPFIVCISRSAASFVKHRVVKPILRPLLNLR